MLRSMTGYGRCLADNPAFSQQWEIKSVNGRYLDLKWHLPPAFRSLEPRLEKVVRRFAARGRVDVSLFVQYTAECGSANHFNAAQAAAMLDSIAALASARGDSFVPDYNGLMHLSFLWGDNGNDIDEDMAAQLEQGLTLALEDWNDSRASEGQALAQDIKPRVFKMQEWTSLLQERAPQVKEERTLAMRQRLDEALANCGRDMDEARLLQETALLADRLDVSEELTRLTTHLERMQQLLTHGGDAGRRLDFTLQECFREINTCGNKIPDVQLSQLVVEFKNELEKCREQVQNLE